jgi:hypothetical protein
MEKLARRNPAPLPPMGAYFQAYIRAQALRARMGALPKPRRTLLSRLRAWLLRG